MIAKHLKNDLPVPYHETFDVLDSSKIQCFMDCPRKFFFRYIWGLESETPNIHLVFGGAWHEAMEHLLLEGYEEDAVLEAFVMFQEYWDEKFPSDWLGEQSSSKNKQNALKALVQYTDQWKIQDRNFKTLYTEICGTVPIDSETLLYVKLDSINEYDNGFVRSMEHKTTARKTNSFMTKWTAKFQVGTYSHFLNVLFPDQADGITINGAILRASGNNEFVRLPTNLQALQMEGWLWEAKHWVDQIRWNFQELAQCTPEDRVMTAFPRNTESCWKYGCDHPELCNLMPNPLRKMDRTPIGYRKNFWDPREREKEAKAVAHLEEGDTELKRKEPETDKKTHHSNE